eukprot:CAMPEP_0113630564 /NCGR_PEP_ID=MMETSP0017_2-20120614/15881_1 /TAXON_ID=2856 /ORGANISM="Cylindrotheca closterium" /LENGTH=310 /DNA_ID=CAMNT_0000541035 /DNA_START=193 /DNA_END=1125 /DNA_ORIENTATION=- /assembly_acc=CAM_ASM_000147
MKVKELRSWLENFGEKHKQHYKRGTSHVRQANQDEENLLTIQTKPSNASTSPMSSADSVASEDGASLSLAFSSSPTATNGFERAPGAQSNPTDLGGGNCYYPDPSFVVLSDDSSVEDDEDLEEFQLLAENFHPVFEESNFESESKNSRRVTFGGIQGVGSMSINHQPPIQSKRASLANDATGPNLSTHSRDVVGTKTDEVEPNVQQAKSIFRKKLDPAALEFLQPKQQPELESSIREPVRAPRSSVGAAIEVFGGQGSRETIVSRRTDELQRRWSENRAVTHVKKTKWCVCEKTGVYKRKIVVEPEYRSV